MKREEFRIRLKAIQLVGLYYARAISKRLLDRLSFALFVLSFILFILVLSPNVLQWVRESPVLALRPHTLQIEGFALRETFDPVTRTITQTPLAGATIEVGGERVNTDTEGRYELQFQSLETQNIPFIVHTNKYDRVFRVSFGPGDYDLQYDFIVR